MIDKNLLPANLKSWQILVLFFGLSILSFILIVPFLSSAIDSFTSFGILFVILVILMTFFDSVLELSTSFLKTSAGFFKYFSEAFNRWLAFTLTSILQISFYLLSIFLIVSSLFFIFSSTWLVILLTILIILFFNGILYFLKQNFIKYFIYSLIIPAVFFIASLIISFLRLYVHIPQFEYSLFSWSLMSSNVFLIGLLILFPLTLLFGELPRAEESLPYIFKKVQPFVFIGILLSGLLFASFAFTDYFAIFYSSVFNSVFNSLLFQLGFFISLILFILFSWFSATRLWYSFSKEKLLFPKISKLDSFLVPKWAFIFQTVVLLFLSLLFFVFRNIFSQIIFLVLFFSLLIVILTAFSIHRLRKKFPDMERPFAIKNYKIPVFILLFISILILLFISIKFISWSLFFVGLSFLVVLSLIYFIFENYFSESLYAWLDSVFSKTVFLQKLRVPYSARKKLLSYLDLISGKHVHEYGAQSGLFTKSVIKLMAGKGLLYVSDRSSNAVHRLKSRFSSRNSALLRIIFLTDFPSSIHPSISKIDFFFSAGIFWHVERVDLILKQLNTLMHKNGRILIQTPSRIFFKNLKWWSNDKTIKDFFSRDGFHILIETHRAWYGEYKIIRGVRAENAQLLSSWFELKD